MAVEIVATEGKYIPGKCNIGATEAANRRKTGFIGVGVTTALWAILMLLKAPSALFAILALPAFVGATGLIQAQQNFCAGYGRVGMFNFSDKLGDAKTAEDAESLKKDRAKAIQITMMAAVAGIAIAAIAISVAASIAHNPADAGII